MFNRKKFIAFTNIANAWLKSFIFSKKLTRTALSIANNILNSSKQWQQEHFLKFMHLKSKIKINRQSTCVCSYLKTQLIKEQSGIIVRGKSLLVFCFLIPQII